LSAILVVLLYCGLEFRFFVLLLCLKKYQLFVWNPPHSYWTSPAVKAHAVLPATQHRLMHPALSPAKQTRFTYPGGMEGWVDLGGWLLTEMLYPPTHGYLSKY